MELVDRFDKRKEPLYKVTDRDEKAPGEYGQSVHVWIINENKEFLIQKRASSKKRFSNMWSLTAGAVDSGESSLEGAIREAKEELGIDIDKENMEFMLCLKRSNSFLDIWLVRQNIDLKDIVMQKEEVSDVKWVTKDEFEKMIDNNEVAGTVNLYFDMFINLLEKYG